MPFLLRRDDKDSNIYIACIGPKQPSQAPPPQGHPACASHARRNSCPQQSPKPTATLTSNYQPRILTQAASGFRGNTMLCPHCHKEITGHLITIDKAQRTAEDTAQSRAKKEIKNLNKINFIAIEATHLDQIGNEPIYEVTGYMDIATKLTPHEKLLYRYERNLGKTLYPKSKPQAKPPQMERLNFSIQVHAHDNRAVGYRLY